MILAQQTYSKKLKEGLYKINSGVLLLNLHKMREYEFEKKILFLLNNGYNDDFHDQNLINYYFYEYVELFPPKFHARPWNNYSEIEIFNKNSGYIYDSDYLYFSNKYPTVRHYLYKTKPIYNNFSHCEDWWYFARTSKYYKGITDNLSDIFNFTYD
jgi:lipopolysaccharide biosynthesis glycosyltransferase